MSKVIAIYNHWTQVFSPFSLTSLAIVIFVHCHFFVFITNDGFSPGQLAIVCNIEYANLTYIVKLFPPPHTKESSVTLPEYVSFAQLQLYRVYVSPTNFADSEDHYLY